MESNSSNNNPAKAECTYFLSVGTVLHGRYTIGKVLGSGGFGITYLAWDKKLKRKAAVKEYFPHTFADREPGQCGIGFVSQSAAATFAAFKERFLEEAENMARFSGEPDIVNVYDLFEENGTAYIAMECLEGEPLETYIKRCGGRTDTAFAVNTVLAAAAALSKIHKKGIIHRDISPDNIFLCAGGGIKLIDFGAARLSRREDQKMTVILKHGFAPPEQYERVNKQGAYTDVYALGAVMYVMLTGQKPVSSPQRMISDTLVPPHIVNESVPENVSLAVMKAMAPDISLRFKSMEEFASALRGKTSVMTGEQEKKKRTRRRNAAIAASIIVLLCAAAVTVLMWKSRIREQTLDGCEITMWYVENSDENTGGSQHDAYRLIAKEFRKTYPGVKIKIEGFEKDEYAEKLSSGKQPDIYQYAGHRSSGVPLDLSELIEEQSGNGCRLLSQAADISGGKFLPLAFEAPAVFVNGQSQERAFVEGNINGSDFLTDDKLLCKTFPSAENLLSERASDMFINGEISCYASKTSMYYTVSQKMPAQFTLLPCEAENVYCTYCDIWCANSSDSPEDEAVLKFLGFMCSEYSQDILHVRHTGEGLPINDEALDIYVSLNGDFKSFFDNKEKFKFITDIE